jgi:sortase A
MRKKIEYTNGGARFNNESPENEENGKGNKRLNVNALVLYPLGFFIVGAALFLIVILPSLKPALASLSAIAVTDPSVLERGETDIFRDKAVNALPASNEKISVPGADIPAEGERYGQIVCETAELDAPLYYGDGSNELLAGVGTYTGAYIPGAGRTILLAGHNKTFFQGLDRAEPGDIINITTSYGQYEYEITGSTVTTDTDSSAYDLKKQEENLILYTCYPIDSLGITDERYFVYAKYVSGPALDLAY